MMRQGAAAPPHKAGMRYAPIGCVPRDPGIADSSRLGKKQPHPSFGMGLLLDAGGRNGCGTLKKGTFFANAHTNIFAALSKWLKTEKRKTNKLTGQSFFTAIRMIQIIRITRMVVDTNRRIQVYTKMERLTGRAAKRAAAEGIPPRNSRLANFRENRGSKIGS